MTEMRDIPDEVVVIELYHEQGGHSDYWWFRIKGEALDESAFVIHGGNAPDKTAALRSASRALQLHLSS